MAFIFSVPVAIKTYALAFVCNSYDSGDGELEFMAASLSTECVGTHQWSQSDGPHAAIKTLGLASLLIMVPLSAGIVIGGLFSMRSLLESRKERTCSPMVDFATSSWKVSHTGVR